MAIAYRPSNTKSELLKIAAANDIRAVDGMTKKEILAVLDAYNAAEDGGEDSVLKEERATQDNTEDVSEYTMFAYAGPSLPNGRLKENAVFRGTIEDVKKYLSDVLEEYPQVEKLIVPTNKLGIFSIKVKTPGNAANKYYSDIVSTIRANKEE